MNIEKTTANVAHTSNALRCEIKKILCTCNYSLSSVCLVFWNETNETTYLPATYIPCNYASINVIPKHRHFSRNLFVCTGTTTNSLWNAACPATCLGWFPVRAYGKYLMLTAKQSEFVMRLANRNRFTITKVLIESMESGTVWLWPDFDPFWRQIAHWSIGYRVVCIFRWFIPLGEIFVQFRTHEVKSLSENANIMAKTHIILINTSPFMDWVAQMSLHNQHE